MIEKCWSSDPNGRPSLEEIFNKITFGSKDGDDFYLEDFDEDDVIQYAENFNQNEQTYSKTKMKSKIHFLMEKINVHEEMIRQLRKEMKERDEMINQLVIENQRQKTLNDQIMAKIDHLEKIY